MFNVCRYKHDRRQRQVSFPKLVYSLSTRQVQHIDVEKQNIVGVLGEFLERFARIVGRIEMLHVSMCQKPQAAVALQRMRALQRSAARTSRLHDLLAWIGLLGIRQIVMRGTHSACNQGHSRDTRQNFTKTLHFADSVGNG